MINSVDLIANSISIAIKKRRKQLDISQEVLADLAGIDRTYASQLERAIANPSLSVLCRLANALQISLPDLLNGDVNK